MKVRLRRSSGWERSHLGPAVAQDRQAGIGVLEGPEESSILVPAAGCIAQQGIAPGKAKMGQRIGKSSGIDSRVGKDFLVIRSGLNTVFGPKTRFRALVQRQIAVQLVRARCRKRPERRIWHSLFQLQRGTNTGNAKPLSWNALVEYSESLFNSAWL